MKTITFVRHGESTANAGGITMAQAEIPLSELGKQQAIALAPMLPAKPGLILTSGYLRTQQTSKPYCERVGMVATANALLNEFSAIDPVLIAGMDGSQRKPLMDEFWREPSMTKRMGNNADTFAEFVQRVTSFAQKMDALPNGTVIFGHGIWVGLLVWQALGFTCNDDAGMKTFRRFQLGLPMPNCAEYHFVQVASNQWLPNANFNEKLNR
jgi:alpha-ribazole phosphatase